MVDQNKLREAIAGMRRHLACIDGRVVPELESSIGHWQVILAAAESTLLKTKMVEMWHLEYASRNGVGEMAYYRPLVAIFDTEVEVQDAFAKANPIHYCVRITGPHKQEVPA